MARLYGGVRLALAPLSNVVACGCCLAQQHAGRQRAKLSGQVQRGTRGGGGSGGGGSLRH
jgi:hypothetical protein